MELSIAVFSVLDEEKSALLQAAPNRQGVLTSYAGVRSGT